MTFGGSAIAWGAVASPFVFVSTNRHFPDTEVVGRDLPSLAGPRQRNSIAADSLTAKTARCSAPLGRNSLLCVHQGVPLPSSAVASDLISWSRWCGRRPQSGDRRSSLWKCWKTPERGDLI